MRKPLMSVCLHFDSFNVVFSFAWPPTIKSIGPVMYLSVCWTDDGTADVFLRFLLHVLNGTTRGLRARHGSNPKV
jgi:hypothetical protein